MAIEGSSDRRSRTAHPARHGRRRAGAFIGAVHRMAARLDDHFELVAGALSSTPEKAKASGAELGLDPVAQLFRFQGNGDPRSEAEERHRGRRHRHAEPCALRAAKEFLKRGIHVICDKPLTSTLADAKKLKKLADESDALFVLTHNYTGYPMVRQARAMVANGDTRCSPAGADGISAGLADGKHRAIRPETGRLAHRSGASPAPAARPAISAPMPIISAPSSRASNSKSLPPISTASSRAAALDDNAHVMMRFKERDGQRAKGMLWCSQVAPGHENGLMVRVYGTKGGLEWTQKDPNYLWYTPFGEPKRLITRGGAGSGPCRRPRLAHPVGPSGRLSRRLRQHLYRGRPRDLCATQGQGRRPGCRLSDDR